MHKKNLIVGLSSDLETRPISPPSPELPGSEAGGTKAQTSPGHNKHTEVHNKHTGLPDAFNAWNNPISTLHLQVTEFKEQVKNL